MATALGDYKGAFSPSWGGVKGKGGGERSWSGVAGAGGGVERPPAGLVWAPGQGGERLSPQGALYGGGSGHSD